MYGANKRHPNITWETKRNETRNLRLKKLKNIHCLVAGCSSTTDKFKVKRHDVSNLVGLLRTKILSLTYSATSLRLWNDRSIFQFSETTRAFIQTLLRVTKDTNIKRINRTETGCKLTTFTTTLRCDALI